MMNIVKSKLPVYQYELKIVMELYNFLMMNIVKSELPVYQYELKIVMEL